MFVLRFDALFPIRTGDDTAVCQWHPNSRKLESDFNFHIEELSMKCANCGKELNADARFCGACGARFSTSPASETTPQPPVPAPAPAAVPEPFVDTNGHNYSAGTNTLRGDLRKLHEAFAHSGVSPFLLEALGALAQGPSLEPPVTLVMGDYRRGKTTIVNRLLGANILGVRPGGEQRAVRIAYGPTWRALSTDVPPVEVSIAPPFSQPNELDFKKLDGPPKPTRRPMLNPGRKRFRASKGRAIC